MKRTTIISLLLSVFLFLQCASLVEKVFTTPDVEVEKVTFEDIALSGVTLNINLAIDNPNTISLTLKKMYYKMYIEGQELVKGDKDEPLLIVGNSKTENIVPVSVNFSGLKEGISGILNKDELNYKFTGVMILKSPVGDLTFDLDEEGVIPLPKPPDFTVEDVTMGDMGLTSATIIFHIKVENNEKMNFEMNTFNYEISINDTDVSSGNQTVNESLFEGGDKTYGIPVNIKLLGLKRSLVDVIKSGTFKYVFKFNLDLNSVYGPYTIPYEKEAMVELY
ncbi:MAG: LEA type 2 family protein [Spirochaetia bacterium]|nr:LEA type 2 family protein [Spirochaetia bacterium]